MAFFRTVELQCFQFIIPPIEFRLMRHNLALQDWQAANTDMLIVTLSETEKQAHVARIALEPEIQRLLVPLMTRPAQLVGAGPVVVADLAKRAA